MTSCRFLFVICLGALLLRLFTLQFVQHPGIADPNHYYNLALRLLDGQGFTIDYIWQFYNPPQSITHPEDFWMPLTAVIAAAPMKLFGVSVRTALIPFVVMGSLLPILGYAAARQFGCQSTTSLFAAAIVGVLPEFMLNSARTDTTIPNTLFIGLCILLLMRGLQKGSLWSFIGSGVAGGLAYLTRGDNILLLPMLFVTALVYGFWGSIPKVRLGYILIVPLVALVVASPWLIRNIQAQGSIFVPNLGRLFFLTDFYEHYAYGRDFNLQTLLASQTPAQLIGKRLFEMAASIKTMYTTLDVFLPVAVIGGLGLLAVSRDRQRWLTISPALILLLGVYAFYTLLAPIANQGGSFKKSYLTLIPLLIPLGAYGLERTIHNPRFLAGVSVIAVVLTAANGIELVRAEARFVNNYANGMRQTVEAARSLPDTNDDGEIILMAQDQFMLRFFGMKSVVIPWENREVILEVAQRYGVDYIMFPPDRPSLNPLYNGTETDSRFVEAAALPTLGIRLYGFNTEAG